MLNTELEQFSRIYCADQIDFWLRQLADPNEPNPLHCAEIAECYARRAGMNQTADFLVAMMEEK